MITSGIYGFSKLIESVRQETGIKNLTNEYTSIRKMVFDAVFDINPYGGLLVKKRMVFHNGNGNLDGKNIKKPSDFLMLDKMGCCKDDICKLRETVSHFIICDNKIRDKVAFTYWALQCDGEGNPIVTNNHAPAVVAYIVWKMYAPKVFIGEGSANTKRELQYYYEDRALEARGHDIFPTDYAMNEIRKMAAMTSKELDSKFCEDYCSHSSCVETIDDGDVQNPIYWWQFDKIDSNLDNIYDLSESFLKRQNSLNLSEAINGYTFNYLNVGKIAFCIKNVREDQIEIYDIFNSNMNNTLTQKFDKENNQVIIISNDYISQSSIYLKFKYNG